MAAIQHVFRRGAIYYWRRRLPSLDGNARSPEWVCVSLKTTGAKTARRKGVVLNAVFETILEMANARLNTCKTNLDVKTLILKVLRDEVGRMCDRADLERAQRTPDLTGQGAETLAQGHEKYADSLQRLLQTNRHEEAQPDMAEFCAKFGLDLLPNSPEMAYAAQMRTRSMLAFHRRQAEHERGIYPDDDQLFLPSVADVNAPQIAPAGPSQAPTIPAPLGKSDAPSLSALFASYADERLRADQWTNKTREQTTKSLKLFQDFTGILDTHGLTRQIASRFKDGLLALPAKYKSLQQTHRLTAAQIVKQKIGAGDERLDVKTINRHLSGMRAFWDWLKNHGHVEGENPFGGLHIQRSKRARGARDQRDMLSTEDLQAIFGSPLYRGCHSETRRKLPGEYIWRDGYYWVPLIAAFTGARLEEVCQLHAEDIRKHDDIWCFVFDANLEKRLKNSNSTRVVPLHPALLAAGLLTHAEEMRSRGETNLFPDLPRGGPDNTFGHRFTKWFTTFRRQLGIAEGKSFHSFRHTFDTILQRTGVDERHVAALLGHRPTTETSGRYFKGFEPRQLYESIRMLDYGIDLSHITGPQPASLQDNIELTQQVA